MTRWKSQLEFNGVIVVSPGSIPRFETKTSLRPAKYNITGIGSKYFAEAEFITLH